MLVLDTLEGVQIVLLIQESLQCMGKEGRFATVQAIYRPIVVSVRADRKGRLLLQGWRDATLPATKGVFTLKPDVRYSDKLCREASERPDCTPVHLELGMAPIYTKQEILAKSRRFPAYAIPRKG